MEHAEFGDLAADPVDFHPVSQPNAVAAHEHEPAEEGDDEILEGDGQAGADDADHGAELAGHAHQNQNHRDHDDDPQADASDAAKRFDLSPIQLRSIEQALRPGIDNQRQ